MKEFDWEFAKKTRSPKPIEWLFLNKDKPISKAGYIEAMQALRESRISKGKNYSPNRLGKSYEYLKKTFGFFPNN